MVILKMRLVQRRRYFIYMIMRGIIAISKCILFLCLSITVLIWGKIDDGRSFVILCLLLMFLHDLTYFYNKKDKISNQIYYNWIFIIVYENDILRYWFDRSNVLLYVLKSTVWLCQQIGSCCSCSFEFCIWGQGLAGSCSIRFLNHALLC
jgi:hypothetical protein